MTRCSICLSADLRPLENVSLLRRRHHCRWRDAKLRPMLGTCGLKEGKDLYRAMPVVVLSLGISISSQGFPYTVAFYDKKGVLGTYSCSDPILARIHSGSGNCCNHFVTVCLFQAIADFRDRCSLCFVYDWITIPLVYTQVIHWSMTVPG